LPHVLELGICTCTTELIYKSASHCVGSPFSSGG